MSKFVDPDFWATLGSKLLDPDFWVTMWGNLLDAELWRTMWRAFSAPEVAIPLIPLLLVRCMSAGKPKAGLTSERSKAWRRK